MALITWFCYQFIAKPGNKITATPWPDPNEVRFHCWHCKVLLWQWSGSQVTTQSASWGLFVFKLTTSTPKDIPHPQHAYEGQIWGVHYSNGTGVSWYLKLQTTWVCLTVQANNEGTAKLYISFPLWGESTSDLLAVVSAAWRNITMEKLMLTLPVFP